jgi:hypothetical protein
LIGAASDRYAGWIGQIYSERRDEKGIPRMSHKVGVETFTEEIRPVESVTEYFDHFPILEIDYTFYRPLLESGGNPTQNFYALKAIAAHGACSRTTMLTQYVSAISYSFPILKSTL